MTFALRVVADVDVPVSHLWNLIHANHAGVQIVDIHPNYKQSQVFVVQGPQATLENLRAALRAEAWVKTVLPTVHTETYRRPTRVIQLHLKETSDPGKAWNGSSAAIMRAAVPSIIQFAWDNGFTPPTVYKYAVSPNALQIDVGDYLLAVALCRIDRPAFDKAPLLVPGLQLLASSVQLGKKPVYGGNVYSPPPFSHYPYSFDYNAFDTSFLFRK
ncbi:hypothetical protein DIPPA_26799 [Diplonema papillatum]|nr:hypothetical protein DIPPA_26799 [Diplonema papillatum]